LSKPYTREAMARKIRHVLRNQQQRNAALQPPIAPPMLERRPLRVLVVEDDELIRFTMAEMLAMLGHEVAEAGDAVEALAELDRGSFDVLVSDVTLPGMSGLDLAREALRREPELRLVFASGRSIAVSERVGLERAVLLQKPYGSGDLAAALKQVMAGA
jgi:CheY-like chemotaxis protein